MFVILKARGGTAWSYKLPTVFNGPPVVISWGGEGRRFVRNPDNWGAPVQSGEIFTEEWDFYISPDAAQPMPIEPPVPGSAR